MPKKSVVSKKAKSSQQSAVSENKIREMIAREAYLAAEKRGFNGGDPVQDWLEAEKNVTEHLKLDS